MLTIGSLGDILAILRRRALAMTLIVLIGGGLTFAYAISKPHSYSASALMQIETPRNFADDPRNGASNRISASYWL